MRTYDVEETGMTERQALMDFPVPGHCVRRAGSSRRRRRR
ncbi:hypothetical protein SAMN05446589_9404 [Streptomyces sp. OV198]|jgi:hypothetical protein|nr:hypothetical protein SAMN05446589_9404 [Streptomyces sp. OV198]